MVSEMNLSVLSLDILLEWFSVSRSLGKYTQSTKYDSNKTLGQFYKEVSEASPPSNNVNCLIGGSNEPKLRFEKTLTICNVKQS